MYGGSILPGKFKGHDVTVVDVFEGVGQHSAWQDVGQGPCTSSECVACPGAGACGGQFTGQHHGDGVGGHRPGAAGIGGRARTLREPRRVRAGERQSGDAACWPTASARATLHPRRPSRTRRTIVAATGGSTNGGLHLPAMAHECGIDFDLMDVCAIFKRTPLHRRPETLRKVRRQGCLRHRRHPQIMRALLDGGYLHEDCMTVTGKTVKQNLENVKFNTNQRVVYPVSKPYIDNGRSCGAAGLAGAGRRHRQGGQHEQAQFAGPRACSTARRTCFRAVENRELQDGDILIIRYEGPKGGPGMREMLSTTAALYGQGAGDKWP
jgi:dihydroxy-acid dehydratase